MQKKGDRTIGVVIFCGGLEREGNGKNGAGLVAYKRTKKGQP